MAKQSNYSEKIQCQYCDEELGSVYYRIYYVDSPDVYENICEFDAKQCIEPEEMETMAVLKIEKVTITRKIEKFF